MRIAILSLLVFLVAGDEPRFGDFAGSDAWPERHRWLTLGVKQPEIMAAKRATSVESITLRHPRRGRIPSYEVTLRDTLRMDLTVAPGSTRTPWSSPWAARHVSADLPRIDFGRLVQFLETSRFDSCDDDFRGIGSLNSPITLCVRWRDGRDQQVRYGNMVAPIELWTMTRLIDGIVQRADWSPTSSEDADR